MTAGSLSPQLPKGFKVIKKDLNFRLGIFSICASVFLFGYAIPNLIYSPSNIKQIVLAPTFWPYIVAFFIALTGIALLFKPADTSEDTDNNSHYDSSNTRKAYTRLFVLGFIMTITMIVISKVGMVWTCMGVFLTLTFYFGTRYKKSALICSILIPMSLYVFFAHVAGVAIPQGEFLRLP